VERESDVHKLESLYKSLVAEAKSPANVGRITIRIERVGKCVELLIEADTLSHLRAVINSFLYLSSSALRTIELLDA